MAKKIVPNEIVCFLRKLKKLIQESPSEPHNGKKKQWRGTFCNLIVLEKVYDRGPRDEVYWSLKNGDGDVQWGKYSIWDK